MKLTSTSATFILALTASINAAPAGTPTTAISKRDAEQINKAIALLNDFNAKREVSPSYELTKRDYAIVTTVLSYIKDTDLSAKIILYFATNSYFAPIVKDVIVDAIKDGTINLTTLFTSLNDSGLAAQVIEDLINDCNFYSQIYQLAESYISDLFEKIKSKISSLKREDLLEERSLTTASQIPDSTTDTSVLTELMESLKKSGLATQVVEELITNKEFLSFGASLIKQAIDEKAITLAQLVDALEDSGIVTSLFKQFFTLDTLKDVAVNALAAAFNKCGGSSAITATATTTTGGSTATGTATGTTTASTGTSTSTGSTSTCKKRKRSYN